MCLMAVVLRETLSWEWFFREQEILRMMHPEPIEVLDADAGALQATATSTGSSDQLHDENAEQLHDESSQAEKPAKLRGPGVPGSKMPGHRRSTSHRWALGAGELAVQTAEQAEAERDVEQEAAERYALRCQAGFGRGLRLNFAGGELRVVTLLDKVRAAGAMGARLAVGRSARRVEFVAGAEVDAWTVEEKAWATFGLRESA